MVPSSYYEIRIAGVLPPEALSDFDRLTASEKPVETVLHGALRDQAALHGLLDRLQMFGVKVLEVRQVHTEGRPEQQDPGQQDPGQQEPEQQDPDQ